MQNLLANCQNWQDIDQKLQGLDDPDQQVGFTKFVLLKMQAASGGTLFKQAQLSQESTGPLKTKGILAETPAGDLWVIDCLYAEEPPREIREHISNPSCQTRLHLLCTNLPESQVELPPHSNIGVMALDVWEKTTPAELKTLRELNCEPELNPEVVANKTPTKSSRKKDWRPFEKAREFARASGLKTFREWEQNKGNLPPDIPKNPAQTYQEWIDWGDWLGHPHKNRWIPFADAKKFAAECEANTETQWRKLRRENRIPKGIPKKPDCAYRNQGWSSWGDWFGKPKKEAYSPFEEARTFARNSGIKCVREWVRAKQTGNLPPNLPRSPDKAYKNTGWAGWYDWLGSTPQPRSRATRINPPKESQWATYQEARNLAEAHEVKTKQDWKSLVGSSPEYKNFPKNPGKVYKKTGWTNWDGFLPPKWIPFEEARTWARNSGIKSSPEWYRTERPQRIPRCPDKVYQNSGWSGWKDWFGKPRNFGRDWPPYLEARAFARSLNLTGRKSWEAFVKTEWFPDKMPKAPKDAYKNSGWVGWADFLREPQKK